MVLGFALLLKKDIMSMALTISYYALLWTKIAISAKMLMGSAQSVKIILSGVKKIKSVFLDVLEQTG